MINAGQIRAARAMLDWPTSKLAEKTSLTVNGINKIERGHVIAQRDTIERIQAVFEKAGVEFLPGSGIRRKDQMVVSYEGIDYRKNLLRDVYETLRNTGGEFLAAHMDEGQAIDDIGRDFVMDQLKKRRKAGISHRMLVRADDKGLIPRYDTYHILPEPYFSLYPLWIFGSRLGLSSRKYAPKSIVINNTRMADSAKKLFDFVWDHTKVVPQANAGTQVKKAKGSKPR